MAAVAISALPALLTFSPNSSTPAISYTLPPDLFREPLHLTLNLCNAPSGYDQSSETLFTAHTNTSFAYASAVSGGFANITVPLTEEPQTLTVSLDSGGTRPRDWSFELGVTAERDPSWHILDQVPLFAYEDADNTSALLTSPTYSGAEQQTPPSYSAVITQSAGIREDLSNSTCYVRSLASAGSVSATTTSRGVVELTRAEGGRINETQQDGRKVQYAITDLEVSTNYTVWGLENNGLSQGNNVGSRLYARQFFTTKRADNCRLLFDVPFCPDVAYSVPAPPSMTDADLLSIYEKSISPIIDNFNLTLSTFPCTGELRKRQGMFSPVRTCSQCLAAYTSWLCSIRMPRCQTYDDSPSQDFDAIRTFPRTAANDSRTPDLPASAFPYSEIPPCINVCNLVQASCPPLISNAFQCPLPEVTMEQSYATPFQAQVAISTVQGGDDPAWLAKSLEDDEDFAMRAKDRWGNVKCNDMGAIYLISTRRWSGTRERSQLSSSAYSLLGALPGLPLYTSVASIYVVLSSL